MYCEILFSFHFFNLISSGWLVDLDLLGQQEEKQAGQDRRELVDEMR